MTDWSDFLRVVVDDRVPEGKFYLLSERPIFETSFSMKVADYEPEPREIPFRYEAYLRMRSSHTRRIIERDPALVVPERLRDYPRWMVAIVGYEWRRAAERPRYTTVVEGINPRSVVMGVVS